MAKQSQRLSLSTNGWTSGPTAHKVYGLMRWLEAAVHRLRRLQRRRVPRPQTRLNRCRPLTFLASHLSAKTGTTAALSQIEKHFRCCVSDKVRSRWLVVMMARLLNGLVVTTAFPCTVQTPIKHRAVGERANVLRLQAHLSLDLILTKPVTFHHGKGGMLILRPKSSNV